MPYGTGILVNTSSGNGLLPDGTKIEFKFIHLIIHLNIPGANKLIECLWKGHQCGSHVSLEADEFIRKMVETDLLKTHTWTGVSWLSGWEKIKSFRLGNFL